MTAITKRLRVFFFGIFFGITVALLGLIDPDATVKTMANKFKEL